ncbi:MAG: LysM peptidoglycan-binding domain-containing protein [Anaerolineae bacterium]
MQRDRQQSLNHVQVSDPQPPLETDQDRSWGEWARFGVLAAVFFAVVLAIALTRPIIFGRIVPAVLGETGKSAPLSTDPDQMGKETPVPEEAPEASPETTPAPADTAAPANTAAPSEEPSPSAAAIEHVVARGETLTEIAQQYGVTVEAIVEANALVNPNHVEAGQVILIPRP